VKRVKVQTFVYSCLHGNQNITGLQFEVEYWPALAVGSAAQLWLPIAQTNVHWTHSLQLDRPTYAPIQPVWPSPHSYYYY